MKAFLLAAGLGTRLKPFTDLHPKALAPVNGQSLLERNIRNLQKFGIYDVVVNVHHFAAQIIETLHDHNGFGSRFEISDESDAVLETGGGLKKAAHFFEGENEVLVMNVDILSNINLEKLLEAHRGSHALATLAVMDRASSRYFLFDETQQLKGWKNDKTGEEKLPCGTVENLSQRAFSGIQVIDTTLFSKIQQSGKFSLVDVYLSLCCHEHIAAFDHSGDLLLDVGKPESLEKAHTLFSL